MKWTTKAPTMNGARRTVIGFAFFPKMVGDRKWVWLEKFTREEIYRGFARSGGTWAVVDGELYFQSGHWYPINIKASAFSFEALLSHAAKAQKAKVKDIS